LSELDELVGVVVAVVDCVCVAAVELPENDLAARAERPPVRIKPPPARPW